MSCHVTLVVLVLVSWLGVGTCSVGNRKCGQSKDMAVEKQVVTDAEWSSFPWTVSIKVDGKHVCGGAIIDREWVLTAASCLTESEANKYVIHVGKIDHTLIFRGIRKQYLVSGIFKYKGSGTENADIGLMKIWFGIDFGTDPNKGTVCLPKAEESFIGLECSLTGWGYTAKGKTTNNIMKTVQYKVWNKETCDKSDGKVNAKTLCVGNVIQDKKQCKGTKGNPLACKDKNGAWRLAGLVSQDFGCSGKDYLGLLTPVSSYLTWINKIMNVNDINGSTNIG